MDKATEIALLEELIGLKADEQLFTPDPQTSNAVTEYLDPAQFEREQANIFRAKPLIIAHSSELANANDFLRRQVSGRPLLITRDAEGELRVFLNVCRHRGTRLVDDEAGCKVRFSCPYHAWTWNNRGEFIGAPHFESGFPDLDRDQLGLKQLPALERHGFVWLLPDNANENGSVNSQADLADYLGEMDKDLAWAGTADLVVHKTDVQTRHCNWKFIVEGGIESYHFRVAHRNSIAPLFNDNLSSYQCFGPHSRSVLPRSTITELADKPQSEWNIREHSNLLYNLFPSASLLVQSDHVIWISMEPINVGCSEVRMTTLKPRESQMPEIYWDKNHAFTVHTLNEDFDIGESIHSGLASGANTELHFGRFEGALHKFNETVRELTI